MSSPMDAEAVDALLEAGGGLTSLENEKQWIEPGQRGAVVGIVPEGWRVAVQPYDTTALLDRPARRRGTRHVQDVPSFAALWNRHADEWSAVYAEVGPSDPGVITAVLDEDGETDDDARNREHRIVMSLKPSPDFDRWSGKDGRMLDQKAFAEHLESGLAQIVEPDGATLTDVVTSLKGTISTTFEAGVSTQNNFVTFAHREEGAARGAGDLEVPRSFWLVFAPWTCAPEVGIRVEARLRYHVENGRVAFGYLLVDLEKHLEGAVRDLLAALAGALDVKGGETVPAGDDAVPVVQILRGRP